MFIVFGVTSKGNTLYWTGFELSLHQDDAAKYENEDHAQLAINRAQKHYRRLAFHIISN